MYCQVRKPFSAFNVEHILPKAFGSFENNLTLDCVCASCNQTLGDSVDLKLGRDTVEGLDRFLTGMKSATDFKHYGRHATTRVEVAEDGPMKGAWMKYTPSKSRVGDFDLEPLPQVGFSTESGADYFYIPLDRLPPQQELESMGVKKGATIFVRTWGATMEDALEAMRARNYTWKSSEQLADSPPPQGRTRVETVFRISHPEFRAVAKIALGYLVYISGPDIAQSRALDEVRRYILHDDRPATGLVEILRGSRESGNGHSISVSQYANGSVVACVTLFCRFLYAVTLATTPLEIPIRDAVHVFDVRTKQVNRIV